MAGFKWVLQDIWRSLYARAFVVCTGFALMVVGPFYNPDSTYEALETMREMLRQIYWGDST